MNPSVPAHNTREPIRAGIALLRRDGRYLVRQRPAQTVYAGYWEFPGGKCEPGESPAEAAARECREETGLEVAVGPMRHTTIHRYPHGLVELFFYDCLTVQPDAEPAAGSGFVWVAAGALQGLRFPEANETILQEIARTAQGTRFGFKGMGGSRSTT
jgi:mutator protein MutT